MNHALQCECGKLRGHVAAPDTCTRIVCYCKDCQAFAHYLGKSAILDANGGSGIVVAHPQQISFGQGREYLACMSLSAQGMLRWYASCCNTPIGNIARNRKMAFVGLSEVCLGDPSASLERAFGPVRLRAVTKSATGAVAPSGLGASAPIAGFAAALLRARITGSYRRTPFFNPDGSPVSAPKVLTSTERCKLP